jgi:HEAT repeat protein
MNKDCAKIIFRIACVMFFANSSMAADKAEIDKLIRDLKGDKPAARTQAAAELARIGPEAHAAVPALIESLSDKSLAFRYEVVNALERIGPAARAAAPALTDLLRSKDTRLYMAAANALGSIGHDSAPAVPDLSDFLAVDDERISVTAAFALARILPGDADEIKPVVPVLVKALHSKHRLLQAEAVRGLMVIGVSAVPELAELVGNYDNDPQSAAAAASTLRTMGPAAYPALPALLLALDSRHDLVVTSAADAVGAIGPTAKDALPALQKVLTSEHALLRTHAAHNIGRLEAAAAPAAADLKNALLDKDPNVRREAAHALGKIGPHAKVAIPALIVALNDQEQPVVMAAAHALSRLGEEAVPALAALVKDPRRGRWAVVILSEVGPAAAPAVGALRAALADADDDFARDVIVTLGRIGPAASDAVPELIKIVEDKDHKLREPAAFALGNIRSPEAVPALEDAIQDDSDKGSKLPLVAAGALVLIDDPKGGDHLGVALPKLMVALNDKSDSIRRDAAAALRQIGPPAASATPVLIQGLKDPNPAVCVACLWALTSVAPGDAIPKLIPQMLPLLSSPSPQVRYTACYAAGSFGHDAAAAIPVLEKYLQDPDQFLQIAAAWALVRIRPDKPEIIEECVDPLIRGLGLPDPQVRAEAATTLGLSGPAAERAVPTLTELTRDPDEAVRKAAFAAVKAIHGNPKETRKAISQPLRSAPTAR